MTVLLRPPQCLSCARWRSPLMTGGTTQTCESYPDGIPDQIWTGRADHRQPFTGDNGLHWEPREGAKFPEEALVSVGEG